MRTTNNTANNVAEAIIFLSKKQGMGTDPLKLQKLLYFAQAISLVRNNRPIFKDSIGAWKYGPVINSVYKKYKNYKNRNIECDLETIDNLNLSEKDIAVLEDTLETFKRYTGGQLTKMTHDHLPWKEVFREGRKKNPTIKNERMREYYKGVFV